MSHPGIVSTNLHAYKGDTHTARKDIVAIEEPLEIRVGYGLEQRSQKSVAVTMRTPGHDFELALGFLFSEGIIDHFADVESIHYCEDVGRSEEKENVVRVELAPHVQPDFGSMDRNFYMTSSCGVCGKASIEAIQVSCEAIASELKVSTDLLYRLPEILREKQLIFGVTGGLHATGIVNGQGELTLLREDVGRHNALDKIVGASFLKKELPLHEAIAILSGRAGFELIQKAIKAQIPVVASVGAPSSLAVKLANEFNLTLIGFLRKSRFNVYAGENRIR